MNVRTFVSGCFVIIFFISLLMVGCGSSGSGGGGHTGNPPAVPTGLTATAGNQRIMLSWNATSGATTYNLQRGTTSGGPYATVSSPTATSYTDTGLTNGTTYYYVISAANSYGQSANSTQVSATPIAAPPPVPAGLIAAPGNQQVTLSWNASSGATSYNLQRSSTSGGPYTTISSPTATSYTDTSLTNGTTYYYVVAAVNAAGQSANSNQVSATPAAFPPPPTNLTATAGNAQVSLSWTASSNATGYNVKRGTVSGGPYTAIASPSTTSFADTGVTNGTAYFYVVTAVNSAGESGDSNQASATPSAPPTSVSVNIDVLSNRHFISPYIYGGAFPASTSAITDTGTTLVRWGGNASSTYNWQLGTDNADNDWYFEDFTFCGLGGGNSGNACADTDSRQWIADVQKAGSRPLMTMVMMNWVAQSAEVSGAGGNGHWSFSVAKYGPQCAADPYNSDAGNGIKAGTCTAQTPTYLTANPYDAYFPLLDDSSEACPSWATDGCVNAVYRKPWATALATAFGSGTCSIPYSAISSCHFYDMDNEVDIWGSTHRDIHPNPSGYDELATTYLTEANNLEIWDPRAVRLGPVSCCWWFYWNGANNNDKAAHGGIDFLPWWLNQVYWQDQIAGVRSLDVFDIHAYPDGPDMTNYTTAQKQAAAVSIYRDYWDPILVSPSSTINQPYTTNIQPNKTIAFRIPRMRAIANMIYPGTPLSFTEWSAAFAGESDFSTALGDADAYGILGRERVSLATRWEAPLSANPNYQALKLYTNYDGSHHGFGTISVSDTNNGNPNLFSSYASLDSTGKTMTVIVLNKDPQNAAQAQFTFNGYTPTSVVSYSFSSTAPNAIAETSQQSWSSTMNFAPYSATLLVITGSSSNAPASEWDLNPDTIMVPAGGSATLHPTLASGTAQVMLSSAAFDSYEGASACSGGSFDITWSTITSGSNGTIAVNAPSTPGFCHFTVTGSDSNNVTQTQGGWIVVGNPAANLTATSGNGQSGGTSTTLPLPLSVTLAPGQSGGAAAGATILFSISSGAGTLSNGTASGSKVMAVTNSSGVASVTLTLPSTAGQVNVTAEGPYGLGHPVTLFTETAQ